MDPAEPARTPEPQSSQAPNSNWSIFRRLAARLPGDLGRCLPTMVVYEICFRTIATVIGAPILAWVVRMLVARSGSAAVSNSAIGGFLITPSGLAAAFVLAMGYLVGQLVLMAGLVAIAALSLSGRPMSVGHAIFMALRSSLNMFRVGIMQLMGLAWLFAPFLGLAAVTYGFLLSGHDINYYLAERPPAFLTAVAIGAVLAVALCLVGRGCIHPRSVRGADPVVRGWANSRCISVEPGTDERVYVDLRGACALLARARGSLGPARGSFVHMDRGSRGRDGRCAGAASGGARRRAFARAGLAAGRDRVYPGRGGEHSDGAVLQ